MHTVYDDQGQELGKMPLSEQQQSALDAGGKVSVLFHTPQLLQNTLGKRNGSFMLYKLGDRVTALTSNSAKEFFDLQAAIAATKGES